MENSQAEKFKERLLARLDELNSLSALTDDARRPVELDQQAVGRVSRMDAIQGQAMALATEERRNLERTRIEQALKRIETGDYGYCVRCEEDIDIRRLDLDPSQPFCISCARGNA